MFFPERITLIKDSDKVLEVGPGGTPYARADIFLEKNFDEEEHKRQRGNTPSLVTDKQTIYYDGGCFPFGDNAFDYVVCSHVLEHVPADHIELFCSELQRIAKKGYIEFPALYYAYLYDIKEHINLMNLDANNCILYIEKNKTSLEEFSHIQLFFHESLEKGYSGLVDDLKEYFFVGFEWKGNFELNKVDSINGLIVQNKSGNIPKKQKNISRIKKLRNKIRRMFK